MSAKKLQRIAKKHLASTMGMNVSDFEMTSSFQNPTGNVQHIHVMQIMNGIPIVNAVANVNLDMRGNILTSTHSLAPMDMITSPTNLAKRDSTTTMKTAAEAVVAFAKAISRYDESLPSLLIVNPGPTPANPLTISGAPFALRPIKASQKYYQTATELVKVWDLEIDMADAYNNVFVDMVTDDIIGMSDWMSSMKLSKDTDSSATDMKRNIRGRGSIKKRSTSVTYRVIPFDTTDIETNGGDTTIVANPADLTASPLGWHNVNDGNGDVSETFGNNVIAQQNLNNAANPLDNLPTSPDIDFQFDFPLNLNDDPATDSNNINAGVTNAFYLANMIHDLFYMYGFTESTGNFQIDNLNNDGIGNDPI
ncbi:hypothetical protein HDU76_010138, partial [Blyttiomyces sp. JEL0837]